MNQIIKTIKEQGVPTDSAASAAQHVGLSGIGILTDQAYIGLIEEITGKLVEHTDSNMLRLTYAYLITDAIAYPYQPHIDFMDRPLRMLEAAEKKAAKLMKNNSWMFAVAEAEPKLDAAGNAKPKKGEKKRLAYEMYDTMLTENKGVHPTRKDAINRFVSDIGMTPAGASTYVAMCKKKYP